jgi:NitT/TauT family transport system permease protein
VSKNRVIVAEDAAEPGFESPVLLGSVGTSDLQSVTTEDTLGAISEGHLSLVNLILARLFVLVAILALWQYLPTVGFLHSFHFLNRLFISSPTAVAKETWHLVSGTDKVPSVWPYFERTIVATIVGGAIGVIVGALAGLLLSNYRWMNDVARPYIVAANSVPRIALVPVVILVAGPTVNGTSLSSAIIVVFIVFFNAYEGGRSVPAVMIENAAVLGATRGQIMRKVRGPYAIAWTLTSLPNAISFSLIAVVTTEILSGVQGLGYLILQGLTDLDSALIFGVVVILSAAGVSLYLILTEISRRLTHGVSVYGGKS